MGHWKELAHWYVRGRLLSLLLRIFRDHSLSLTRREDFLVSFIVVGSFSIFSVPFFSCFIPSVLTLVGVTVFGPIIHARKHTHFSPSSLEDNATWLMKLTQRAKMASGFYLFLFLSTTALIRWEYFITLTIWLSLWSIFLCNSFSTCDCSSCYIDDGLDENLWKLMHFCQNCQTNCQLQLQLLICDAPLPPASGYYQPRPWTQHLGLLRSGGTWYSLKYYFIF